jgi:hypothetical protein
MLKAARAPNQQAYGADASALRAFAPLVSSFGAMNLGPSRISSLLAAAYVVVFVGGIFVHFAETGDLYTLRYSFTLPAKLIVTIIGTGIALGLWRGHAWAWHRIRDTLARDDQLRESFIGPFTTNNCGGRFRCPS